MEGAAMTTLRVGGAPLGDGVRRLTESSEHRRGLIGRSEIGRDEILVFDYGEPELQVVHNAGVRCRVGVAFVVDGEITRLTTLRPWVGLRLGTAETLIEAHPDTLAQARVGDQVTVEVPA
jgi:uncharacterized membrane protein (UPF0127 family)